MQKHFKKGGQNLQCVPSTIKMTVGSKTTLEPNDFYGDGIISDESKNYISNFCVPLKNFVFPCKTFAFPQESLYSFAKVLCFPGNFVFTHKST